MSPHNQDSRLPADMSQFPPPIIVDMIYGCAAVLQWGIPSTTNAIHSSVGSSYYDKNGSEESGEDEYEAHSPMPAPTPAPAPAPKRLPTPVETARSMQAKNWANRHIDQSEPRLRTIGEAMDVVALLWSQSRPKRHEKPPPTQEEDMRQDRVHAWLQTQ